MFFLVLFLLKGDSILRDKLAAIGKNERKQGQLVSMRLGDKISEDGRLFWKQGSILCQA